MCVSVLPPLEQVEGILGSGIKQQKLMIKTHSSGASLEASLPHH